MIVDEHLFYYTTNGYGYYCINYKGKNYANRRSKDEILEIYEKCKNANWELDELDKIKEEYGRATRKNEMKYIYKHPQGMWILQKQQKYYACSYDLEEIKGWRDALVENGWDESVLHYEKRNKWNLPRYVQLTPNGKYRVYYKGQSYGVFDSVEDAVVERDLLIRFGWEYDFIDLY